MRKYHGGEIVPKGVYLNLPMWEFVQLYHETPVLPGNAEVKYFKVPAVLAVVTGPFAGLAFIIFLPLIGIVGIVSFLAYKAFQWTLLLGHKALQPTVVGWKPGTAYLAKRGGTPEQKKPIAETEGELADLEREVTRQKQQGE